MAINIENNPSPEILMNSMRSIGYSFQTAVADIIDNSISAKAKNIYINVPISNDDLYVSILDDGDGMDNDALFAAMKYGTGRANYDENDLGRFGMGLKSASLSQCRILTVVSKVDCDINAYQWNLDVVEKNKRWDCLKLNELEISTLPTINKLKLMKKGTLVIWQDFDLAFFKSNGNIIDYIHEEMNKTEWHLRLVFHRFLNRKLNGISIYINGVLLNGFDPFLTDHMKTDAQNSKELNINGKIITVQPFILPHQSDLNDEDIEKIGGMEALRNGQGFYIYRNQRLIIYGTWFRLESKNVSSELYKYGRIKVDIPNSLDNVWEIDIKKQNAAIPKVILNNLKGLVSNVCRKSSTKSEKRQKLSFEQDNNRLWNKKMSRDNKDIYYINTDSKFIKNLLDDFSDNDKDKLLRLLDILSATLPFDDIYNSICNNKRNQDLQIDSMDSILIEGIRQYNQMKNKMQISHDDVLNILFSFEPFTRKEIQSKLLEVINNAK